MSDAESPAALRDAAIAFAREAGAIVREGYGVLHAPELKGAIDLVTEYDRRSEALLLRRIRERFPTHRVLAEESGTHEAGGASTRWLIDPLDGTTNFAHNYPFFCVSIGVERDGELIAGAIFDPVRDELFAAAKGEGATLNGAPIRVSQIAKVDSALLVTGFPYWVRERPGTIVPLFQAFLVRAQGVRRDGSAALNLAYVACGKFDGFWEHHLSAWDLAAGVMILREAGGVVTSFDGGAFAVDRRQIVASNGAIHDEMLEIVGKFQIG